MTPRIAALAFAALLTIATPAVADPATCKAMDALIAGEEARKSEALQELKGFLKGLAGLLGLVGNTEGSADQMNSVILLALPDGQDGIGGKARSELARMRGKIEAHSQTIESLKAQKDKMNCDKPQEAAKPEPPKPPVASKPVAKPKPVQQASKPAKKPKPAREVVVEDEDDGGPGIAAAAPLAIGVMGIGMGGGGYRGGYSGGGYRSGPSSGGYNPSGGSSRRY
jgi:hypothetical protein